MQIFKRQVAAPNTMWERKCQTERLLWRDPELRTVSITYDTNMSSAHAEALIENQTVTHLNIFNWALGCAIINMCALTRAPLLHLSITGCQIQDISFLNKSSFAKTLRSVDLSSNGIRDFSPLKRFTSLKSVDISCNPVRTLWFLKNLPVLEKLDFSSISYSQGAIGSAIRAPEELFAALKGLSTELRSLKCANTSFPGCALKYLVPLKNLQKLNIGSNNLRNVRALRGKNFKFLNISFNKIASLTPLRGSRIENLICESCFSCDFDSQSQNKQGGILCDILHIRDLKKLVFDGNSRGFLPFEMPDLSSLSCLTHLDLSFCHFKSFTFLNGMNQLSHLAINNNEPNSLAGIQTLTSLKTLEANWSVIKDVDACYLSQLKNLENLSLYGNPITKIPDLSALSSLTRLDLSSCAIGASFGGANATNDYPCPVPKSLKMLHLGNNKLRTIEPFAGLTELTHFYFDDNLVEDISCVRNLTQLIVLKCGHNPIRIIPDLSPLSGLENFNMEGVEVNNLDFLRGNISLRHVVAEVAVENLEGGRGGCRGAEALQNHMQLTSVDLSSRFHSLICTVYNGDNLFFRYTTLFSLLLPFLT